MAHVRGSSVRALPQRCGVLLAPSLCIAQFVCAIRLRYTPQRCEAYNLLSDKIDFFHSPLASILPIAACTQPYAISCRTHPHKHNERLHVDSVSNLELTGSPKTGGPTESVRATQHNDTTQKRFALTDQPTERPSQRPGTLICMAAVIKTDTSPERASGHYYAEAKPIINPTHATKCFCCS